MLKIEDKMFVFDRPKEKNIKYLIKSVLYPFFIQYYRWRVCFWNRNPISKEYKVSICAIFKNEAAYLKEWIEYHKIVGIDHFYLYNNNSEDNYLSILNSYIEEGTVTLTQWPQNQAQMKCYQDGIERFKNETEWMAFIDIDEFIVPNVTDNVYDYLKPFQKKYPVVMAYWKMFGTSGKLKRDMSCLVTEELTVCWHKYVDIGKIFYNTLFDIDVTEKHNTVFNHYGWGGVGKKVVPPINIFGKFCFWNRNPVSKEADASFFPLQINHYFSKTYEEYLIKKLRGDAYFKINPRDEQYFYRHEKNNNSVDYKIYRFLIKLKLALAKGK